MHADLPTDAIDEQLQAEYVERMKRLYSKHRNHPALKTWQQQHSLIKGAYTKSFAHRNELLLLIDEGSDEQ